MSRLNLLIPALILTLLLACGCENREEVTTEADAEDEPVKTVEDTDTTEDPPSDSAEEDDDATLSEDAVMDAVIDLFGKLGTGGEPRFLTATMTTRLEGGAPVDSVDSFNTSVEDVSTWVAYDDLSAEVITAELLSPTGDPQGEVQEVKIADKYGSASFTFARPENGWAMGGYEVLVTGGEIEEVIEFAINNHDTHASSLVDHDGAIRIPGEETIPGGRSGSWHMASVEPPENGFSGVQVNRGRALVYDYRGSLATSDDGTNWEAVQPSFDVDPTRFRVSGGEFFAFTSSRGSQYVSGDGITWTEFDMGSLDPPISIMHTHDGYIARGERNDVLHSEDGRNWETYRYEAEGQTRNMRLVDVQSFTYDHDEENYWTIKDEVIEIGRTIEAPDQQIPTGRDSMQGLNSLFTDQKVLFWDGYRLFHLTDQGVVQIDDQGFLTIEYSGDGFIGCRRDGQVLTSSCGEEWEVLDEGPEHIEVATGFAVVGDYLVMVYGGGIYYMQLD